MLSLEEAQAFRGINSRTDVCLSDTAWQRIFEELITYEPFELDYKGFVYVVLAVSNIRSPSAARFFWRVLDYDRSGRLTAVKIRFFYNAIAKALRESYEVPSMELIVTEVFDMLRIPDSQAGASFEDFVKSKQGHVVISLLLDVNGFWRYDNRDSLANEQEEEEEEEVLHPSALTAFGASAAAAAGDQGGGYDVTGTDDEYDDSFEED